MIRTILTSTALIALTAMTQKGQAEQTSVTIYSSASPGAFNLEQLSRDRANIPGYAMVRQDREIEIRKGAFELPFSHVTATIDPTTVTFSIPEDPDLAQVLDQNYQFDLVSTQKLMEKYLGEQVRVDYPNGQNNEQIEGTLLGTSGGLIIQRENGSVITLSNYSRVTFPALPGGLLTKPTLLWLLNGQKNTRATARVSYQTSGITWWADYNAVIAEDGTDCHMQLGAWVSIVNQTGADFFDTQLKLIAGDVNRVQPPQQNYAVRSNVLAEAADGGFQEKSFFEYHLYTLPRHVDLPDRSSKQIELFPTANEIACEKELVYNPTGLTRVSYNRPLTDRGYYARTQGKIETHLKFVNAKNNRLGLPLPSGRIRVNQVDTADGSVEFIGENVIDHTPENETIRIKLGHAFDVLGERRQSDISIGKNFIREQFEIELRNQKNAPVTVQVIEPIYRWSNWTITEHSHRYDKLDAGMIRFDVDVAAKKTATVKYTVLYEWPQ